MVLQFLLIIIRAILAAAIRMEKAAFGRLTQAYRHVQRPDRQILFHPVTDCPPDDAAAIQIKDNSKSEPAFRGPDVSDVASPFLVGPSGNKVQFYYFLASLFAATPRGCRLSVVTLCRRVRTGFIPLIFINLPTRRSPTSSPMSFNSIVILGRP